MKCSSIRRQIHIPPPPPPLLGYFGFQPACAVCSTSCCNSKCFWLHLHAGPSLCMHGNAYFVLSALFSVLYLYCICVVRVCLHHFLVVHMYACLSCTCVSHVFSSFHFLFISRSGVGVQVTGLAVSDRHPYMFSAGLDKMVKCWDLEYNKVRTRPFLPLSTLLPCMTTLANPFVVAACLLIYQVAFLIPPPLYLNLYLFFPSFFPKQPAYKT